MRGDVFASAHSRFGSWSFPTTTAKAKKAEKNHYDYHYIYPITSTWTCTGSVHVHTNLQSPTPCNTMLTRHRHNTANEDLVKNLLSDEEEQLPRQGNEHAIRNEAQCPLPDYAILPLFFMVVL